MTPLLALALILHPATPAPKARRYVTVTLQFPVEMPEAEVIDAIRMVDDLPREGVYVIDVKDLGPHRPKSPWRPLWLPKIPESPR